MSELAKAYVQIIPSAQGISGSISDVLSGESKDAGEKSGKSIFANLKKTLVGLGVAKMVGDMISDTSAFDQAMTKAGTLFTGTADEFSALEAQIMQISSATGMAATQLAEAAYSAESASVPMEDLGFMLEQSAHLAMAGFTDVDTALSATAKTMNAYGVSGENAIATVQGILLQTQNLGITTVGELGASLAQVTPTAAAMGVSFQEVGASMALLTARGVPTAQATTQLRSAFAELGKTGTKAQQALAKATKGTKYADMSFQQILASGGNLGEVFGMMQNYANETGVSMLDLWSSIEGGNAAMSIAADVETYNKDLAAMSDVAGQVDGAYEKMSGTMQAAYGRMTESAKNLGIALLSGGDTSTAVQNLMASLSDLTAQIIPMATNFIGGVFDALPDLAGGLFDLIDQVGTSIMEVDWPGLGQKILDGVTGVIDETGAWLKGLFDTAWTAVQGIDWAAVGTAVINGVKASITAGGEWLKSLFDDGLKAVQGINWSELGTTIRDGAVSLFTAGGEWLKTFFDEAWEAVKNISWADIGQAILDGAVAIFNGTGEFLASLFGLGKDDSVAVSWSEIGQAIWDGATGALTGLVEAITKPFTDAWEAIKGAWDGVTGWFSGIFGGVKNDPDLAGVEAGISDPFTAAHTAITGLWDGFGSTISTWFSGIDITDAVSKVSDWASGAWETISSHFDGIGSTISSWFGGISVEDHVKAVSSWASGAWEDIKSQLGTASETISDWFAHIDLGNITETVSGWASKAWENIKKPFEEEGGVGKWFENKFADAKQAIGDALNTAWSGVTSAAEGAWNGITTAAGDAWNWVTGLFGDGKNSSAEAQEAIDGVVSTLNSGVGDVETAAQGVGDAIVAAIEGVISSDAGDSLGKSLMSGMASGMSTGAADVSAAITTINKGIELGFTGGDMWKPTGKTILTQIGAGITDSAAEISSAVTPVINATKYAIENSGWDKTGATASQKVVSAFKADEWRRAGLNLAQGLAQGILAGRSAVVSASRIISQAAVDTIRTDLKIHSPSRVMAAIGAYIPSGLAIGIESDMWRVQRAVSSMSTATTQIQRAGIAGGAGYTPYNAAGGTSAGQSGVNAVVMMDRTIVGRMVADEVSRVIGTQITARR